MADLSPDLLQAPCAYPVFFRTYSRRFAGVRESWEQVCERTVQDLATLGNFTPEEKALVLQMQRQLKALTSGRWLWVGGTEWIHQPENFSGAYNCTSQRIRDWRGFGLMMDLAMQGAGTGAVLEAPYFHQLPPITTRLAVTVVGQPGDKPAAERLKLTQLERRGERVTLRVGDSRRGWVEAYQSLLELASDPQGEAVLAVTVDLGNVRPKGEVLKGFGGIANPALLPQLFPRVARILNQAVGRQLTSIECCLLIDEAAATVVAGNIRRCLAKGALVHTAGGLVPIEKVRIGDRVLTSQGFYPVTNWWAQGEQSLCRIRTEDGWLECTPDHKVAVLQDVYGKYAMVKAKDLKAGDRLVFVPQVIPGIPTELPEFRGKITGKMKPITIPALTDKVAYFLGYLQGDGCVASDGMRVRFRVHASSPQILEQLTIVGALFGIETSTIRSPEQCQTQAYDLQFNSAALNQYLQQFKQPFQPLRVPDCILLGTPSLRQAYLAGLADADGCHSQGVLVASVYPEFLHQVQTVYASLGITVRLGSSVRQRNQQWEGELVTVGESAFYAVTSCFEIYSLTFTKNRRNQPKSFKDHGFPTVMVRPLINTYQYHWSHHQRQMITPTLKRYIPQATALIPVAVVAVELDVRTAETFDLEVANVHEFVCAGVLVSNSAGMRQFSSEDCEAVGAKANLWNQDDQGNWRIDPERDALRMANHTRVFHHKPSREECIESVRSQFYSGEGAVQWAGEAIARSNRDVLDTPEKKARFLELYHADPQQARGYLRELLLTQKMLTQKPSNN